MVAIVASPVGTASVTKHYKFFQNTQCEYFPCHKCDNVEAFNCMFCYCPLYNKPDCGGKYEVLKNSLKDCSGCLIPHHNYDYVVDKLKRGTEKDEN